MLGDAVLVAGKDLRIELRSRATTNQVLPFAVLVLVLFAIAFDADRELLQRVGPGLFWLTVLFASVLAVQRSFAIESADGGRDTLRMTGLDPAGVFLGKAAAIGVQLLILEVALAFGVVVLFGNSVSNASLLLASAVIATIGVSAAATIYGVLAAGLKMGETLLPILLLPVVAPILLAAARVWETAFGIVPDQGAAGLEFLTGFAVIYLAVGIVAFGPALEEA